MHSALDELGIPKNPYFDPSHASAASLELIPRLQIQIKVFVVVSR